MTASLNIPKTQSTPRAVTRTIIRAATHSLIRAVTRPLTCGSVLSMALGILMGVNAQGWAQGAEPEPLYLRYQGAVEGVGPNIPDQMTCAFSMHSVARAGEEVWSEVHEDITLLGAHFTVALGSQGDAPLAASLFTERLTLRVRCNLDIDDAYEIDIEEPIGLNPRAISAERATSAANAAVADNALSADSALVADTALTADSSTFATSADSALNADTAVFAESAGEVRGPVFAAYIEVGGARVISETGEWTGTPPVAGGVRVGGIDLITAEGAWSGPLTGLVEPQDQDLDGFNDLIEVILESDPNDPESTPTDINENQRADLFEVSSNAPVLSVADQTFTSIFEINRAADVLSDDPQTVEEWTAATLNFDERGAVRELTLSLELSHSRDTRALDVTLVTPSGARLSVREVDEDYDENEGIALLSEVLNISTEALLAQGDDYEINGVWSVILRDEFGQAELDVSASVTACTLTVTYRATSVVGLDSDLTLSETQRILGVGDPQLDDEVANKGYIDTQVTAEVSALNESLRTFIGGQTQAALDTALTATRELDPTIPDRFAYRARTFKTYNELSGAYILNDSPTLFGGVTPSAWSSGASAAEIDLNTLDALLTRERHGGADALIDLDVYQQRSVEQGVFSIVQAQVENLTEAEVEWSLEFSHTCYDERADAPQRSSLALNGALQWSSAGVICGAGSRSALVTLTLPPNQVSDIIFVISAGAPVTAHVDTGGVVTQERQLTFALINGCLTLPVGLRYRKTW